MTRISPMLLAFASAASLLLGAPAGAIPIPTRTTPLTLGFEWELNTEFCQDVGDGKVSMLQGVEKGDPWWTNHEDLGGLKWTPDHVHETSMLQTIELITGPLTREQIMPMVNAMKADAASLEEPNLSDPETKVHQFTQKTVEVYKPKDDHKIQNCPTDAWFTSVPRNVPSQHCTFPMKFGHFHRAGTPHNVFLDAAKSVATELGHPENPQLLDALFLFVSLAAHKGDHRKLGLAPRVNPSDLAHLIDSDDVRQAIFQARTIYAGTPKPEGDPKEHDESDLIQRMKHNWNREDRFGVNSDFDPDSSTSIAQCARPRREALAYQIPFSYQGEKYFLVEDRMFELVKKYNDPRFEESIEKVFSGDYAVVAERPWEEDHGAAGHLRTNVLAGIVARRTEE